MKYPNITIVAYDHTWPEFYIKESQQLKKALGDSIATTHHIGSTAIINMPAKPVIDIIVELADLRDFENRVLAWPLVREAYMLSGETDYILKCVASDLPAFQDFILKELTAAPNVASVKTNLTIRRAKLTPGVPIPSQPTSVSEQKRRA